MCSNFWRKEEEKKNSKKIQKHTQEGVSSFYCPVLQWLTFWVILFWAFWFLNQIHWLHAFHFLISNNAYSNSLSTARWIWSLENWSIMSFDVWEYFFLPPIFCSFFLFLHKNCPHKKTHAREKKHTTTHRKTLFLSLRNNINTPRTKTHRRERKLEITTRAFFFSSLSSFQQRSLVYIYLSVCA